MFHRGLGGLVLHSHVHCVSVSPLLSDPCGLDDLRCRHNDGRAAVSPSPLSLDTDNTDSQPRREGGKEGGVEGGMGGRMKGVVRGYGR